MAMIPGDPSIRADIEAFLKDLRDTIVKAFESFELTNRFQRKEWNHHSGGGGEISLIRGDIFEKAAVNWSAVWGDTFPMKDGSGPFYATGVSLITHMTNPLAPTVHMNIRYIVTHEKTWFGGGYDLTPMGAPNDADTHHFHTIAKDTLDAHDPTLYQAFSQNAREYFYIPHWQRERGVGGIFFDHYATGDFQRDLALWKQVGSTFLHAILPIYQRRTHLPFTPQDKQRQLSERAKYVEFNLLYDRGTRFGFQSGGNPEAILCSLPPLASW